MDMRDGSSESKPTWTAAMRELAIGRGLFKYGPMSLCHDCHTDTQLLPPITPHSYLLHRITYTYTTHITPSTPESSSEEGAKDVSLTEAVCCTACAVLCVSREEEYQGQQDELKKAKEELEKLKAQMKSGAMGGSGAQEKMMEVRSPIA